MARTLSSFAALGLLGLCAASASAQDIIGGCTTGCPPNTMPNATFGKYQTPRYNVGTAVNLYSAGGLNTQTGGQTICGPDGCVIPPATNDGFPTGGPAHYPTNTNRGTGYPAHRGTRGDFRDGGNSSGGFYSGRMRSDDGIFNPDLINRPDTFRVDRDRNFGGQHYYGDGHNHGAKPGYRVQLNDHVHQPLPAGGLELFPGSVPVSRPMDTGFGADAEGAYY